jgi:leader peptidase (prepilin peptidase)/N-methyltransferase
MSGLLCRILCREEGRDVELHIVYYVFAFVFGSAIGSFLNVLIYRLPRQLSIVAPHSFCPECRKAIRWYENIPIVSFLMLKGKCSGCRNRISLRYPIVEAITALLFVYALSRYGFGYNFFFIVYFFCGLTVITFIDFSFQVIPDLISIPGIFLGIIFQALNGNFIAGLFGMLFGGGMILFIRVIGGKVYKKEVMGLGDVYLTAMIGAFVGFPFILPAIFIGALVGATLGIVYIASTHQNRESPIPFGPFLSLGGAAVIIFEPYVYKLFSILGIYL